MREITLSIAEIYIIGTLATLPIIGIFYGLFYLINPEHSFIQPLLHQSLTMLVISLILMVIHELIHGFVFQLFTNEKDKIEFGFSVQHMTPYCTCQAPISKIQYILSTAMPTIVLGCIPSLIAIPLGADYLQFMAALMMIGGIGDMMVIIKLLRYNTANKDVVFVDHPTECGLVVFEKRKYK